MHSEIREHRDGVQLIKHFEEDEYELPAVVYEFTSGRSETVSVRVVESISDSFEPEKLGFYKDHKPEEWAVTDDELVLEVEIEPESDYKIGYTLRPTAPVEMDELVASPQEFSVSPEQKAFTRGGGSDSASGSVSTISTESTESTTQPSPVSGSTENGRGQGESSEYPWETARSNEEISSTAEATETTGDVSQDKGASLIDQFVAELQSDRVSDDSLDYLEDQFGSGPHKSGSMDARLTQLQRDFADLRAYTTALEEFLDENGSANEIITSLETRLDMVQDEVDSLESTVTDQGSEVTAIRNDLRVLQSEVESVSNELSATANDIAELSAAVERIDEQLPAYDVDERFSELEDDLSEMSAFTTKLQEAFQESFKE